MTNPTIKQREVANEVIKNRAVRKWVLTYIKHGRGYSDPTDMFDEGPPDSLPKKFHKYFEGGEEQEVLYSSSGAIALMDAAKNLK